MDAMQREMERDADPVVRKVAVAMLAGRKVMRRERRARCLLVEVKEEAVQNVLDKRPNKHAKGEAKKLGKDIAEAPTGQVEAVHNRRKPQGWDHPPRRLAQRFEEVSKQGSRRSALVMTGSVDLVQIEIFGEPPEPNLREHRFAQVEKLVRLVVDRQIRVFAEILGA